MNIALATLVLLIVLYPGFLFRRFYYTAEFSKEYFKQTLTDLVFASILPGFIIHIIGFELFVRGRYTFDVQTLGTLLSGTTDAGRVTGAFNGIGQHAVLIIEYFAGVSILAIAGGLLTKQFVRRLKLDRKFSLFRFQNEWHYVFSGEMLDFPDIPGTAENVDFKYVDVLMRSDEGTVIYMGVLSHYTLNKEGGIDRIYLSDVSRRYLREDEAPATGKPDNRYYDLPGEFFIIPYNLVLNMHITYYSLDLTPEKEQEIKDVTPEA
ncbi:hypothetical protein [Deminuibacter soli]|uniref:Uncharacterized protein n=1 Tax=Deminuibacter soli TaxID=2291815 RepID=A0A3E1NJ92_9BACT|nr:hypothetical protein [Deminuibacter soli]RFM28006.1 hypothetical protein DXN05_10720 [Deminuibacter soli]